MRTVLVTGVSRGLGRALVERFDRLGHRVLGCARSEEELGELRARIDARHDLARVDVADAAAVGAWAERLVEAGAVPDLVVNNAAAMNAPAPLWRVPAEEFEYMLAVNVAGVANVVRAFVPALIESGRGVVVNVSSGWGRSTSPEVGPYCTTKWALEGFTSALAQELPRGLAAVSLSPGVIDTPMLRKCWADEAAAYPKPDTWAPRAVEVLLELGPRDNGRVLSL